MSDLIFTTFDSPSAGTGQDQGTFPLCLNNNDSCAGVYVGNDNLQHGFIRTSDGTITEFNVSGATETFVAGINSSDTVCGFYYTGGSFHNSHGFFRTSDGTITTFDVPSSVEINMGLFYLESAGRDVQLYSVGNCINNNGDICGIYRTVDGFWHGFIRSSAGTFTTFDLAGDYATGIVINSINNNGDVCGSYLVTSPYIGYYNKGFIRQSDGTIIEFSSTSAGTHGNNGTLPYIINDSQKVAGYYVDDSGHIHSFIRNADGSIVEYDVTGTTASTLGTFINGDGLTTGWYGNPASPPFWQHGFIRNLDGTFDTYDVLNMPDTTLIVYPYSINSSGCVAGNYANDDTDDVFHGFIGCGSTPPPPPTRPARCATTPSSGTMITGEFTRDMDADWDQQSTFIIQQSDPLPFTLRGIVMRMEYNTD